MRGHFAACCLGQICKKQDRGGKLGQLGSYFRYKMVVSWFIDALEFKAWNVRLSEFLFFNPRSYL